MRSSRTLLPVVFRGFTEADVKPVKCRELLRGVFVDVMGKVRLGFWSELGLG